MGYLCVRLKQASLKYFWCLTVVFLVAGCVEPYAPKIDQHISSFLVINGSINSQGVTTIQLARTLSLGQAGAPPVEAKARVSIEEEGGRQYPLAEGVAGTYTSTALALDPGKRVRLHLLTATQKEYASDFMTIKQTPAIDSVSWEVVSDGVQISVSTHDNTQQSRYYRWDYEETWQFTSAYISGIEYKNRKLVDRTGEDIYHCWGTEKSSVIRIGNTTRLSQDVVANQPLTILPSNSAKLRYKYSILVRQYAQTLEEYNYWDALRKNTENIGTLFDPLPTQLTGNVHNLADKEEVVLGFVGAQSVAEKRIFIEYGQLPRTWRFLTGYEDCTLLDTVPNPNVDGDNRNPVEYFSNPYFIPVAELRDCEKCLPYYTGSTVDCVDCRKRGANVKPAFWK